MKILWEGKLTWKDTKETLVCRLTINDKNEVKTYKQLKDEFNNLYWIVFNERKDGIIQYYLGLQIPIQEIPSPTS